MLDRRNTNPIMCSVFFPPSLHQTSPQGHGILTVCPSTPTFVIALGPTNPWLITSAKETLGLRRTRISRVLWLLVPTFSLPNAPPALPSPASLQIGTLSYHTLVSLRSRARYGVALLGGVADVGGLYLLLSLCSECLIVAMFVWQQSLIA